MWQGSGISGGQERNRTRILGRGDRDNFKAKAIGAAFAWLHQRADLGWRRCRDVWSYDSIEAAESGIVRLCALWESRDPAKENIPTFIELIDDATIIDMARGFLFGANK